MPLSFQNNNKPVAEMGVGLIMPREVDILPFGHMWLWWQEKGKRREFRGFYYVEEDIAPSIAMIIDDLRRGQKPKRGDYHKIVRYFASPPHKIRGQRRIDTAAKEVMESPSELIFEKTWEINKQQLMRLKSRCSIPNGKVYKNEGFYDWNKNNPESNNCSRWVLIVLHHILQKPAFLECSHPIQLARVVKFIEKTAKWARIPDKYTDEGGKINVR